MKVKEGGEEEEETSEQMRVDLYRYDARFWSFIFDTKFFFFLSKSVCSHPVLNYLFLL